MSVSKIFSSELSSAITEIKNKTDNLPPDPADASVLANLIAALSAKIGNLNDYVSVPYSFGNNSLMAFLTTSYYHVHGRTFVYPEFANNVIITSAAGIWNQTGSITEVIPANALNVSSFDIHWINIYAISANCAGVIEIFKGTAGNETRIGITRITRTTNFTQEGAKYIQIPQQSVNERISCRLTTNIVGSIQCAVSFEGHYYA